MDPALDPWDELVAIANEDGPSVMGAPPPPPPPSSMLRRPEPSKPPQSLIDLGAPPADLELSAEWRYKLLCAQAYDAAMDEGISQAERRKEVRAILSAAANQFPDARRQAAVREIKQSREKLDARRKQKTVAKLEAVPVGGGAKVIQIRGDRG